MRTKTLLLTAALSAAGVATSMAQVFSVNAVGYVVKTVPAGGFALISNPLNAQDNKISSLFTPAPAGAQIFKFDPAAGTFATATFDDLDNAWTGPAANQEVKPGEGVFIKNPTAQPISFTFVGEVPQGNLENPLPAGFSIKSSMVPQAGTAKELGLQGAPGDQIFQFNAATQSYNTPSTFDDLDNDWVPPLGRLEVGEAFFLKKVQPGTWTRQFTVN